MTPIQWMFHYREIKRQQDKEFKEKKEIIEVITNYLELVGAMANPDAGKKLQEIKEQKKNEAEINADTFAEDFQKLKEMIPATLVVKNNKKQVNRHFLEKVDTKKIKNLGVKLEEGE